MIDNNKAHSIAVKHYDKYIKKQIKDIFYGIKTACRQGKTEYNIIDNLAKETLIMLENKGFSVIDLGEFHHHYVIKW